MLRSISCSMSTASLASSSRSVLRRDSNLGNIKDWDIVEGCLKDALNRVDRSWTIYPDGGALYSPMICVMIHEGLRNHQYATLQIDFQLPEQFNLRYRNNSGGEESDFSRPVMIHRAKFGSVERMIALLAGNCAGRWDFWLSPPQVQVIPVASALVPYAVKVRRQLQDTSYYLDVDISDNELNKKIHIAEVAQYNFVFVVGAEEERLSTVNVQSCHRFTLNSE